MSREAAQGYGVRMEGGGALASHALRLLAEEPLHTATLATLVFGSRGDAGAAARMVWTLLGDDPRFVVSGEGVWSLRPAPPAIIRRLAEEEWVVVDVETTGGAPTQGHRVTEIAAVRVSGGEVREVWSTLVNPERPIPSHITSLTGISNAMVADAPHFGVVAAEIAEFLRGRVFVAHNAPFDWQFLSAEMERTTGLQPAGRHLCTVKLSRKLLPHLPSRALGALAEHFGVEIAARHRAAGDAVATAHVLLRLVEMLGERGIEEWNDLEVLFGTRSPRRARRAAPRSMDRA